MLESGEWITLENLKVLKKYLRSLRAEGKADKTRDTAQHVIEKFLCWCGNRHVDRFIDEDVYDWIDYISCRTYTRKGVTVNCSNATTCKEKTVVKKFLAFVREDLGAVIKLKAPKNELPDIFTQEEIEKLINAAMTPRDKALISVAYESGARRGELLSCRIKNVTWDEFGAIVTLPKSKTKTRRVRLIWAASFLRQFLDCHPLKDNREAFLFCSLHKPYGVISSTGLHYQLKIIAERAGIPAEKAYLHNLRHSRATHLSEHLTEAQLKEMFGWTQSSTVTGVYVHLAAKDIDRALLAMHGMAKEPDKKLNVNRCGRCKEINNDSALYCFKCGYPLKEEGLRQLEKETDDFESEFAQLLSKYPNLIENLAKYK